MTTTLTKYLTRDIPVLGLECWYKGKMDFFYKFFGITHPANPFIHRNGAFEYYTDTDAFDDVLPQELAVWIRDHNEKLQEVHTYMVKGLNYFANVKENNYEKPIELLKCLQQTTDLFMKGFIGVIVAHHVPIFHTRFKQKGVYLFDEKIVSTIITWREQEGNIFFNEGTNTLYFLLDKIAKLQNWDPILLKYITFDELSSCISNNSDLPTEQLTKRKNSAFMYYDYRIIPQEDIEKTLADDGYVLSMDQHQDAQTISGTVASKGSAKGNVRLIFSMEQLGNVQQGDIIVTPMTSVWCVPAMKKAAAIITDEGGITCHAAIISRELQKPCIIGTKIATEVLQEGELVEVDATKGIITRLND